MDVGKVAELSRVALVLSVPIRGEVKASSPRVTGVEALTDLELPRSF